MNNVYPVTSTRRRKGAARGRESSVLSPYETCTRFVKTMTSKVAILLYVAIFGVLGQSAFAQSATCATSVTLTPVATTVCTNAGTNTASVSFVVTTVPADAIQGATIRLYRNGNPIEVASAVGGNTATQTTITDPSAGPGTYGYDVSVLKTNCPNVQTAPQSTVVTVLGTPTVSGVSTANSTICSGASASFNVIVNGPITGTVSVTLYNVNTSTYFDVSQTASASGTTTITVTPSPAPVQTTTYQVVAVRDLAGCGAQTVTGVQQVITVQNPPQVGNVNTPNPMCAGQSLVLTAASGATGTLTYQWYKNGVAVINGATGQGSVISGANAGTLTITNAQPSDAGNYYLQVCSSDPVYAACGGCGASNVVSAVVNPLPTATFSTTGTQNVCTNSTNTLTATFTGTGPFSLNYAINGVAQPTLTSNTNTVNVPVAVTTAGSTYSYTITSVSDANCVNTVNNPSAVTYVTSTFDFSVTGGLATVCYGSTTSRIITPTGVGSNTITYTLTGPVSSSQSKFYPTAATFSNLPAGTYTITALDNSGAGCTVVRSFTIASFTQTTVSGVITAPITCNGGTTSVVATFGPTGATYNLQIASGTYTATATGLAAGTYTFTNVPAGTYTVQSTNTTTNCVVTSQLIILQPNPVVVTGTPGVTALSCFGGTTTIQASVTGGNSGTFTYVLSGGPTAGTLTSTAGVTFTNVRAGNYTITVTDAKGCTGSVTNVNITEPAQITGNATATAATCNGGSGSILVNRTGGGTGNAVYTISGPSTQTSASTASMSYTFASVAPGTYTVTITDANNCSQQVGVVTVSAPPAITATLAASPAIQCGGGTTTLNINNVAGGNGNPITWTLTGTTAGGTFTTVTSTANYFTPVYAGTYTVTAANSGCAQTLIGTVTVTQPAPIVVTTNATTITCNGGTSTVTITATGGTGTKTYQLINANTAVQFGSSVTNNTGSATFTGVPAGTYNYVVTDNGGCSASSTPGNAATQVVIAQPAVVTLGTPAVVNATCFGGTNGSIAIRPTGGSGSYTVTLVGTSGTRTLAGTSTVTFTGLSAGTYTLTVLDVNGCASSGSVVTTVTEPASSGSGAPNLVLSQDASTNTFAPPVSTVNVTYGIANPGANAATGVVLRVTKPTPDYTVTLAAAAVGNDNARWVETANTSGYVEFTLANDPNGNNSITCGSTTPLRVATVITRTAAATGKGDFAVTGIVRSSVPDSFPADNSVVAQFTAL